MRFIDKADQTTRNEIEELLVGNVIEKAVRLELTYDEIDNSIDNLRSVLFTTGYLTQADKQENGIYKLKIPNEEIREVFKFQIKEMFDNTVMKNRDELNSFWKAFSDGDAPKIEEQ